MNRPIRSFSSALVWNVAGLVLVIGAVALAAMVWQAVTSTREAAGQELQHALDRSVERVRQLVEAAEMTAESAERVARMPAVVSDTLQPALETALAAFEQRPELSYLGVALAEHGEYGNLERKADGRIVLWLHPGARPGSAITRSFILTELGFAPLDQQPSNGYDVRARPFYRAALAGAPQGRWLPAYQWIVHGDDGSHPALWGYSYVKALHDHAGQLIGVLDVDLDLPALNRFLATVAAQYGVRLQVVELGPAPRLVGDGGAGGAPGPVPDALLELATAQQQALPERQPLQDGERWVAARRIELRGGLGWMVVATREAALIGAPLRSQLYQAVGMGLAMVFGLVLISVRMARRLGGPLAELERSVERTGQADGPQAFAIEPVAGGFRETRRLGQALHRMASAVRQREEQLARKNLELLEAKEQQVASLALKGALFESTDTALFNLGPDRRVAEWNAGAERLFGVRREQVLGRPVAEAVAAPDGPADWDAMLSTEGAGMFRLAGAHGAFDAELRVVALHQGGQRSCTLVIHDVSARRHAERRLREERDYADAVLNSLPGVFYHCDARVRLQRWNRNFERITGADAGRLAGVDPLQFMPEDERARVAAKVVEVFETGAVHFEASYALPDGRRIPCLFTGVRFEHGGAQGFVGLGTDISERKRAEQRLQHLATHDALTDLPNRTLLQDRFGQAVARSRRTGRPLALLLLDLDRFKTINDAYGHAFGDEVLKLVGARLLALLRASDTVARHGGDQFLVLLTELQDAADADTVAQQILDSVRRPVVLQQREIHLSGSAGLSVFPRDGESAEALIKNADQAMYRAKTRGRSTFVGFTQAMNQETQQRVSLETQLRGAAAAGQLQLVYQPKVSLASGAIVGCEALLRWHHPELGQVPPSQFIPVAEDSGLIVPISDWVLRTACLQARAWSDAGLPRTTVAVNISARQLLQQDLAAWTLDMLRETGLAPGQLELELTESLIAQDVEKMIATFDRLKQAGVRLSIDDFGTGYSSLSYLKHFRVDTLKIDQSFVRNMLTQTEDETIVRAVIALAHNLNFKVIAEGVETAAHCRLLREHGCDEIQGYYFGRPVPASAFEALLRGGQRLQAEAAAQPAEAGLPAG
ncbi:EAL domain-containing protein [Pseudorhodoferax sp.]|uniref:EAL domain-containing protein n=1 Tax=Pseudorhodoferax sp. TaxID=1993553 RepID=UPI002DD6A3AA|nr:EAL domain-containing protein [Pseudorhodoferax sp.]